MIPQSFGSRALWRAPSTSACGIGDHPTPGPRGRSRPTGPLVGRLGPSWSYDPSFSLAPGPGSDRAARSPVPLIYLFIYLFIYGHVSLYLRQSVQVIGVGGCANPHEKLRGAFVPPGESPDGVSPQQLPRNLPEATGSNPVPPPGP